MRAAHFRQRGFAVLMAAIILVVIIMVVLSIGLNMSATGVYDSGAQNNSVEALFLAESGIERASRRYRDNGALCAANGLVEGPLTIVASSNRQFRIVSSAGNAVTCTVDARGEIGDIEREVRVILQRTAGGGVIVDPGFDNPGLWPSGGSNATIAGGVATFVNPAGPGATRDQLRANPPGAVDTSAFTANVNIAMATSFTYTVVGTVRIRVRIRMSSGPDITRNFNSLSGSGTITLAALGSFDPTDITRIDVDIQNFGNGESVVLDNFYVGPATGGAATVTVTDWTERVP